MNCFPCWRALLALIVILGGPRAAQAHWCSNIFAGPARLVVKSSQNPVFVSTTPIQLRVYVQNNFPYRLYNTDMRGSATGYTIQNLTGTQDILPGQNVSYIFSITKTSGSDTIDVSTLNLQVRFRVGNWRGDSNPIVNQNPSLSLLQDYSWWDSTGEQSPSLASGTLIERFPGSAISPDAPFFGRTGAEALIGWFGYRFCWSSGGSYRCGSNSCPSPCAEGAHWSGIDQFPQNCMRAGVDLGAHKASLGSHLAAARDGATNALLGTGSSQHKCVAAVVGAYLWQGGSSSAFESALSTAGNAVPAGCQAAATRILSSNTALNCSSYDTVSQYSEKAACAAAEGLRGNDGPVTSILIPNAGDGDDLQDYRSLYYAYMLYLVTAHRRATAGGVTYYPDAGGPLSDGNPPPPPDTYIPPPPDTYIPPPVDTYVPPPTDTYVPPPTDSQTPPSDTQVPPADSHPPTDGEVGDLLPPGDGQDPSDAQGQEDAVVTDGAENDQRPSSTMDGKVSSKRETSVGGGLQELSGGCGCRLASGSLELGLGLWSLMSLLLLHCWRRRKNKT